MKKILTILTIIFLMACFSVAIAGEPKEQPGPTIKKAEAQLPPCDEGWEKIPGGCYTFAANSTNVLIVQTYDMLVSEKSQTLNWKRGDFKRGQRPEVEKLVTKLTDITGIINVLASAYTVEIMRVQLYEWGPIIPQIKKVFEASEIKKLPE